MMGGSNGGHHTKWMLESYPELYDGGIAGFGFNSQVSQWGSIATLLRHYDVIAGRIDDIIAARSADPAWDPSRTPLAPPLTPSQLQSLQRIYAIPAQHRQRRRPTTSAGGLDRRQQWRDSHDALLGYLRDSMPRFDPTFNPDGGALTDDELRRWDPDQSPPAVVHELRKLDLTGKLTRPLIVMHGTADPIVSPGEAAGYASLVSRRVGRRNAERLLADLLHPRHGARRRGVRPSHRGPDGRAGGVDRLPREPRPARGPATRGLGGFPRRHVRSTTCRRGHLPRGFTSRTISVGRRSGVNVELRPSVCRP